MADNTTLKDGSGQLYGLRAKDVSVVQDGSLRRSMTLAALFPVDYLNGGQYRKTSKSGAMAAGLAAGAPIYSFWWPSSTLLALIRRVKIQAFTLGTGFAVGLINFDLFSARAFSVQLVGTQADLSGNMGKTRTSMATSSANIVFSNTAALTGGVYTPGSDPKDTFYSAAPTAANTPIGGGIQAIALYQALQGEPPLIFVQNEGFIINATVPATGTWGFAITSEWDEVPLNQSGY